MVIIDITRCFVWQLGIVTAVAALSHVAPTQAQAQTWSPQKPVEFIVPTAAGSSMDVLARLIQDVWQRNKLVTATMTVQARPGGGGLLAWSYVSQRAGDGHYLAISGPTLLANDVLKIGSLPIRTSRRLRNCSPSMVRSRSTPTALSRPAKIWRWPWPGRSLLRSRSRPAWEARRMWQS